MNLKSLDAQTCIYLGYHAAYKYAVFLKVCNLIKIPAAVVVIAILNAMGNNRVTHIFYYSDYRLHILYYYIEQAHHFINKAMHLVIVVMESVLSW